MTIEQINALILDDVKTVIQSRVFSQKDPIPEYDEENDGEYETWFDALFTTEELDAEFLVYKQELIDAETERLRKEDLSDRFEALDDMRSAFHNLHPDTPNPAVWLRDLIAQSDHADAESKLAALEAKDVELKAERDASTAIESKRSNGQLVRKICSEVLDLVAGNNLEKSLTVEQIDTMETTYSDIFKALQNLRPDKAQALISAMTPDGTLVTSEDKTEYLSEFAKYGL